MNTTIYLDQLEIIKLNKIHNDNFLKAFRDKLEAMSEFDAPIKIHDKVKSKKLIGVYLSLESWRKLNFWIIHQTSEEQKPSFRDAILTLLGVE